ncbi:MAG: hypothetical protein EXQ70_08530 [Solirubrobacterales bacterium]|nr:hypothetical protein [Solirubrobacterales bacterium]
MVSQADINHYDAGDPHRAVLEWWRDVQYKNARGARAAYATKAKLTLPELNRELGVVESQFVGVPNLTFTDHNGRLTTVYMELDHPDSDAQPRSLSVNLRTVNGEWLLTDNLLIEQSVGRVSRLTSGD